MVKCEVINQEVSIKDWKRLKNIKRLKNNEEIKQPNYFEIGDTFETDEEFASYLAGETPNQPIVCIKVLEIIPDKIENNVELEVKLDGKKVLETIKKQEEKPQITKTTRKSRKFK